MPHYNKGLFQLRAKSRRHPPEAEAAVHAELTRRGIQFSHQYPFAGRYFLDLYFRAEMLAVEVDGPDHGKATVREADRLRDEQIEARGVKVLRVSARSALQETARVVDDIAAELAARRGRYDQRHASSP